MIEGYWKLYNNHQPNGTVIEQNAVTFINKHEYNPKTN